MQILQPPGWVRPKGYSNGIAAEGRMVFLAGMAGWNREGQFETDSFPGQVRQALRNILSVLAEASGKPEHICRMTWYVTDKQDYLTHLREVGEAYRAIIGNHFPAMALVEVGALIEDRAKVEIEATAVIPHG